MSGPLTVVHVTSEYAPWVKVGGLADATAGLVAEQVRRGMDVTVVVPGYPQRLRGDDVTRAPLGPVSIRYAGTTRRQTAYTVASSPARVVTLADPAFADGRIYPDAVGDPPGADRWALFARGALAVLERIDLCPDVLHVHDHPGAWIPLLLRRGEDRTRFLSQAATVLTVHNLAHQGLLDEACLHRLGLDTAEFVPGGALEYWGKVNPLKTGLLDADRSNTVSRRYAEETREHPNAGHGLAGVLRDLGDRFSGIRNGLDPSQWDPRTDPLLDRKFSGDLAVDKSGARRALVKELGLEDRPERLVVGMVTRLDDQKGLDLVRAAAERLLERPVLLALLGSGSAEYEAFLTDLAARRPGRVHYTRAFDEPRAHRIYAGADLFLMPSRFEPCGLAQLIALRYGSLPIARETGGLAETLTDASNEEGSAFLFSDYTAEAMLDAVDRAVSAHGEPLRWQGLRERAVAARFTWEAPAEEYAALYRAAINDRATAG